MLEPRLSLDLRILVPSAQAAFLPGPSGRPPLPDPAALKAAFSLAAALGAQVGAEMVWERVTSLPELPPGASLTGLSLLVAQGKIAGKARPSEGARPAISPRDIRIEEFSGRLVRRGGPAAMDWSRLGHPCLLLRTTPCACMGSEAEAFLLGLRGILAYLGLIGPEGFDESVRANAYVALVDVGGQGLGSGLAGPALVKIRNLNSINFMRKAVDAEISRQEEVILSGGRVRPESRLWNEAENRTESFRDRPEAPAARYLEAGLPPLPVDPVLLEAAERESGLRRYGIESLMQGRPLPLQLARSLASRRSRLTFLEETVRAGADPYLAAIALCQDLARLERREERAVEESGLNPSRLAAILGMRSSGRLTARMARQLMEAVFTEDKDPENIINERGWKPISDPSALQGLLESVIAENPASAESVAAGEEAPREHLIGAALRRSGGQADPAALREILRRLLPSRAIRLFHPEGAKEVIADALRDLGVSMVRLSPWPAPRNPSRGSPGGGSHGGGSHGGGSHGGEMKAWAAHLAAIASAVQREGPRALIACLPAGGSEALSSFLALCLADSPLPLAIIATPSPENAALSLGRALSAIEGGPGVYILEGDTLRPQPPSSLAPGAWEADEEILTSILTRAAAETQAISILPGSAEAAVRAAQLQGAKALILELPDLASLVDTERARALGPLLRGLRKRGILMAAAFRNLGMAALPQAAIDGARAFLQGEGAAWAGLIGTDALYGRIMAASLEAEDTMELKALIEE